jgi:hypothetical protein
MQERNSIKARSKKSSIGSMIPKIHPINCAVYSLKDIADAQQKSRSLEELAVLTIASDVVSDIIKIGEPKLKTTLFAINKVGDALGLDYVSIKTG